MREHLLQRNQRVSVTPARAFGFYAIPYGPLGELAHRLFVRRDLERIFDFRRDAFARKLGDARPA